MSRFSDFIRNATPEERAEVYGRVLAEATERQLAAIPAGAMRVGPNTDAIVWRTCPTHEGRPE